MVDIARVNVNPCSRSTQVDVKCKRALVCVSASVRRVESGESAIRITHKAMKDVTRILKLARNLAQIVDGDGSGTLVEPMPQTRSRGIKRDKLPVRQPQKAVRHDVRVRVETDDHA